MNFSGKHGLKLLTLFYLSVKELNELFISMAYDTILKICLACFCVLILLIEWVVTIYAHFHLFNQKWTVITLTGQIEDNIRVVFNARKEFDIINNCIVAHWNLVRFRNDDVGKAILYKATSRIWRHSLRHHCNSSMS